MRRRKKDEPRFMASVGNNESHPSLSPFDDPCCETSIYIHNYEGTVNVYNCSPVVKPMIAEPPSEQPAEIPESGFCIPLAPGHKPKQSLQEKLRRLLANNQVPSVLASSAIHTARRFLLGERPANSLEVASFNILQKLSPNLRNVLACSLQVFDSLPSGDRDKLFAPEISALGAQPLEQTRLVELVSRELLQRASLEIFGDKDCFADEHPGLARFFRFSDDVSLSSRVRICRVNGLRTNVFSPLLDISEYTPEELQRLCTLEVVDDKAISNCQVQTEDCPGHKIDGVCLRAPDVMRGDGVVLEGVNFFNTDARVRLQAKPPGTIVREVEAHVCGDVNTPLTEVVNGVEQVIADCRVQDRMTFRVPEDLPEGIYGLTVVFSNNSGNPDFGDVLESEPQQFIRVVPSVSDTFQITSEQLNAVKETSPEFFGSDEVAIQIIAVPIDLDFNVGGISGDNKHKFGFGDVDSGESRRMSEVIFQQDNIGGVALSIIGFEVDDEDAFKKQVEDFTDAFIEVLRSQWDTIAGLIGGAGGLVAGALGASHAWAAAIAAAITLAIDLCVALWAPADLIIEDFAAFTALDLATLVSPNFPSPPVLEFTSAGGIDVRVEPISKDVQYRERRIYKSESEDSEYQITLRYNRF